MPPTLRSSTQNSPASPTAASTTPSSSPRKVPHCGQCGRPRAGHPRSGCPYAAPETPTKRRSSLANGPQEGGISNALSVLNLSSPEDDKAFIRERRRQSLQASPLRRTESLVSLSASAAEIVESLLKPQPGVKPTKVVHWSASVLSNGSSSSSPSPSVDFKPPKNPSPKTLMPCTLIPPTPESSLDSVPSVQKQEAESPVLGSQSTQSLSDYEEDEIYSPPGKSMPLTRTMSDVERDIFVSRLSQDAPASVYIIPRADAEHIASQAIALKFSVYVSVQEGGDDDNALLILGRSENAVQDIVNTIRKSDSKVAKSRPPYGALVTGVAAGAALMFGGLASM